MGIAIGNLTVVADHAPLHRLRPGTLVTEKDAARLPEDADVWALRMRLVVEGAEPLIQQLNDLADKAQPVDRC